MFAKKGFTYGNKSRHQRARRQEVPKHNGRIVEQGETRDQYRKVRLAVNRLLILRGSLCIPLIFTKGWSPCIFTISPGTRTAREIKREAARNGFQGEENDIILRSPKAMETTISMEPRRLLFKRESESDAFGGCSDCRGDGRTPAGWPAEKSDHPKILSCYASGGGDNALTRSQRSSVVKLTVPDSSQEEILLDGTC